MRKDRRHKGLASTVGMAPFVTVPVDKFGAGTACCRRLTMTAKSHRVANVGFWLLTARCRAVTVAVQCPEDPCATLVRRICRNWG